MRLGIIGRGQAARALVPRWIAKGHTVTFWRTRLDGPVADTPWSIAATDIIDVIIVAVSDSAIAEVAAALATRPSASTETWLHLSGVHPADVLRVAPSIPAHVGGLHPLVALANDADPTGAVAGIEGDAHALAIAEELARDLGMTPVLLAGTGSRALYHAAAVTVAGQVTALFSQAMTLMQMAGLDPKTARSALQPLLSSAARNLGKLAPQDALTGPIARGDASTIAHHLAAIDALPTDIGPPIAAVYRQLARAALDLVKDRHSDTTRRAIEAALDDPSPFKPSSTP
jgi:predicted short-subunit dehydrogenase-like oxidoreductase (DUF2520 family)